MVSIPVLVLAAVSACPPAGVARPDERAAARHTAPVPMRAEQGQASKAAAGQAPAGRAGAYYLFLRARSLDNDGDVEGAIALYQQAAKLDPAAGEIPAALAELYARQNRVREALAAAESALRINPDTVGAHWVLGTIYAAFAEGEAAGRTAADRQAERDFASRAARHLEAVLQSRGNTAEPELLLTLGRLYLKTSDFDKAIVLLSRLNELEPDSLDGAALLSDAYTRAGRTEDAIKLLERGAERDAVLYPALATALERVGRWKDAAGAYAKASEQGVNSPEVRRRWAVALLNADGPGDAGRARDLLQNLVKSNPKDTRALYFLVQAQRQLHEYEAAEATARQLMAADPGGASGPYALAQVYEQRHEYRKVVQTLEPVVERMTPASAAEKGIELTPILLRLGFAYIDLDQPDRAITVLQRAKETAADNSTVDVGLAQAQIAAKRYAEAAETAGKARIAHPDDVRLTRLQADALRQGGQMDRAVAILEQVRQAHPDDPSNYVALAQLLLNGDRTEQAAGVMRDARTRFPDDVSVLFHLGAVYERQKKYDEAEKTFKDVLARDPRDAQTLNYLGYMLADRGLRLEESVTYIQRALDVEPNNPAYLDSLGWAYFKMNRLVLAERNLRQAAEDRLRDSAVQDHWGDLLLKLGRREEAIAAWKRALAGDGQDIDRTAIEGKIRSTSGKIQQ